MYVEEWILEKLIRERNDRERLEYPSYFETSFVNIPFYMVQSEQFAKTEQELKAYSMPITKIIEDNSVKDIAKSVDDDFRRKWAGIVLKEI